jgi:hypothetical protein
LVIECCFGLVPSKETGLFLFARGQVLNRICGLKVDVRIFIASFISAIQEIIGPREIIDHKIGLLGRFCQRLLYFGREVYFINIEDACTVIMQEDLIFLFIEIPSPIVNGLVKLFNGILFYKLLCVQGLNEKEKKNGVQCPVHMHKF